MESVRGIRESKWGFPATHEEKVITKQSWKRSSWGGKKKEPGQFSKARNKGKKKNREDWSNWGSEKGTPLKSATGGRGIRLGQKG